MFSLSAPMIWLILLVAFILIEIATVGLLTIWFAGGALAAFFCQRGSGWSGCAGNRISDCVVGIGSADPTTGSEKIQFGAHPHKCADTDRRGSSRNRTD